MKSRALFGLLAAVVCLSPLKSAGAVSVFFDGSQRATLVATNSTSDTVSSRGYLFQYSRDKWWSAWPGGEPTGRFTTVNWPAGVQAQAVTVAPPGGTTSSATITVRRVDGQPFALKSFTAKLLANTAGAGAAIEIMPQLNGQDAFPDPVMFDATGYAGNVFSYASTLAGYDTYVISLWVDFALIGLTVSDASALLPTSITVSQTSSNYLRISWPADVSGYFLQASPEANLGSFVDTGLEPVIQGANHVVLIPATNSMRYFRLVH